MENIILIIDSGATNSNWKFINEDESFEFYKFKGFNLSTNNLDYFNYDFPAKFKESVTKIFFFGAGTGIEDKENQLRQKLISAFPKVKDIIIGSDLLTAGLALSNNERSVIGILGTGSNCCVFKGTNIAENINNLGFILGDEGSGYSMGRHVLQDYFYHLMKKEDEELFTSQYQLTRDELIQKLYHTNDKPNRYIASYCDFLITCSPEYRKSVSLANLDQFFSKQLEQFKDCEGLKHHFSGSISWYFKEEIKVLCSKYGYKLGNIIQNPIDSLSFSNLIEL